MVTGQFLSTKNRKYASASNSNIAPRTKCLQDLIREYDRLPKYTKCPYFQDTRDIAGNNDELPNA